MYLCYPGTLLMKYFVVNGTLHKGLLLKRRRNMHYGLLKQNPTRRLSEARELSVEEI